MKAPPTYQTEIQAAKDGLSLGLAACTLATLFGVSALVLNKTEELAALCKNDTPLVSEFSCIASNVAKTITELQPK
jgi:hypothetical protein